VTCRLKKVIITSKNGTIITKKEDYNGVDGEIHYKCEDGHETKTSGSALRNSGSWCRECTRSLCERTCRKIFEHLFKKPFTSSRHLKNPESGQNLELDGYNDELKLAFEYNGLQHYKRVEYFMPKEEDFINQQKRDKIREELCLQENIRLISHYRGIS